MNGAVVVTGQQIRASIPNSRWGRFAATGTGHGSGVMGCAAGSAGGTGRAWTKHSWAAVFRVSQLHPDGLGSCELLSAASRVGQNLGAWFDRRVGTPLTSCHLQDCLTPSKRSWTPNTDDRIRSGP
ncbi:hypothetical protein LIP_0971 [Limnochorda pilosa]|uniref:Uncharacterized protein n=1 Tax=Limnochorda pilosa TaxID=1555112 RepID=A0A0K2SI96_LIMPI|nr:hypothetical protein LIP_0971 [Limnochorda pilosa]